MLDLPHSDIDGNLDVLRVEFAKRALSTDILNLITASIRTPHTVFDAALNRTSALLLKAKAGTDVALAYLFALNAGFVSASSPMIRWH
jgi:hypothetical protein